MSGVFVMTLRVAWRSLRRNGLRSTLTMLGIVFGVAAVIAMVAISQGADALIQARIQSLGTNLIYVRPSYTVSRGARSAAGTAASLRLSDVRAIVRDCPSVVAGTAVKRRRMQVVAGRENWNTDVQGVGPDYLGVRAWPLRMGRFFTRHEHRTAARVCILGRTVADNLFGLGHDPLGATIRVRDMPCRVVGVLAVKGQTGWGTDQDDTLLVPFATADRKLIGGEMLGIVDYVMASARSPASMAQAEDEIRDLLRARHNRRAGHADDFRVRNMQDIAEASASASHVMTLLLASVASVALLVGGIGIMNILLVSVTERTREIGLRMAVGAKRHHILLQFLVESATLSLAGGLLGVLLGVVSAHVVAAVSGWPSLLSPPTIVGAFVFSGLVGIFFGYYPAHTASRLDPIAALRHE